MVVDQGNADRASLAQAPAALHPAGAPLRISDTALFALPRWARREEMRANLRNLCFPVLLGLVLLLGACQNMGMQQKSLYDRLGGKDAIVAVVDDFVGNVAADNRINGFFARTDVPRLKRNLVDQICAATGGPCTYTGRDMKTAHAGMGVTNADFDALVGDLVKTLDKFKVPDKEKGELLAILGPLRPSIVGQ
jgi:hemoglobin